MQELIDTVRCRQLLAWLLQTSQPSDTAFPQDLAAHAETCPLCQGALHLLSAGIALDMPASPEVSCAACERDIAAYMSIAEDAGLPAAMHAYPHVWPHLLACEFCAEDYLLTLQLVEAEQEGLIGPLKVPPSPVPAQPMYPPVPLPTKAQQPARPVLPRLRLPRLKLRRLLAADMLLGATYGDEDGQETVVAQQQAEGYFVTMGIVRQNDSLWQVIVTTVPPIVGRAILNLGLRELVATFDGQGRAVINAIPEAELRDSDDSDLVLTITQDT